MVHQENNIRIAKNTVYLYIRMFATMAVSLYASRVVLQVLGVSDYGLYNVIGGVVSSFSMLSAALIVGTQRFLTYAMGENNENKLKRTFSIAFGLHVILGIIVLVLAETIGLWFVYNKMNIPGGRMTAALWVYQSSIIAFIVNLIQVPFQSCLISHERMSMYAYMSIYDVVMKLMVVFVISVIPADKLILYSVMVLLVQTSSVIIYNFYCRKNFSECTFQILFDKKLAKEMISYMGWNLFGGSVGFVTGQGINILFNIFCGTIVNAAQGIAQNINSIINQFVSNFQTAVNPQIVKQFAAKEYTSLYRLVINNSRLAEYLYLFIAIPLFIEIEFILRIWLGEVPEYTTTFIRIVLLQSALSPIDYPIAMLIHASGRMKWPQIISFTPLYSIFIIAYFLLSNGFSPSWVYAVSAIVFIWKNLVNIYFANRYTGISFVAILKEVYFNVFIGAGAMFIVPYIVSTFSFNSVLCKFMTVCVVSVFTSLFVVYNWGLTSGMRKMVVNKLNSLPRCKSEK